MTFTSKRQDKNDVIYYLTVQLFLIIAVLCHGLYFLKEYAIVNIIMFAYVGYLLINMRNRNIVKNVPVSLYLFLAVYVLSIIYSLDKYDAAYEVWRITGLLPAFIIGQVLGEKNKKLLYIAIVISGVFVSILGLFCLSQIIYIPGMLYGNRIQSTFKYANVTALYLMICIVLSISFKEKKYEIVKNMCIYLLCCGLILTYSRTMWIIFLFVNVFILISKKIFAHKYDKFKYIAILFMSVYISAVLTLISNSTMFLCILIIGGFISALLAYMDKQICTIFICVLGFFTVFIIFFLQTPIVERILSINFSSSELNSRIRYYGGAIKLISDYPILGTGAMGWAQICEKYIGDYVKYVHNYYLQILCDVGIIGFAFFLTFIIKIIYVFIKSSKKDWHVFVIIVIILMHSLLDIGMHFNIILMIFYLCCGIIHKNIYKGGWN